MAKHKNEEKTYEDLCSKSPKDTTVVSIAAVFFQ